MAYETGVASSPTDLVDKLATFAAANGWSAANPTGGGKVLSKGNVVVGVFGQASSVDTRGATAVDTGLAWNAQPNNAGSSHGCNTGAGPFTAYHFYTAVEDSKDLLAACIEISAGVFRHWIACDLVKFGTWTGGTYTDSQYHQAGTSFINVSTSSYHRYIADAYPGNAPAYGHFRCEVDGQTPGWQNVRAQTSTSQPGGTGVTKSTGRFATSFGYGYSRWNLRTHMWPLELYVNRASSLRSPAGRVPGMRYVNMRNHTPGEIVTIGGDNWQFWPCVARYDTQPDNTTPSSAYQGYAYKR